MSRLSLRWIVLSWLMIAILATLAAAREQPGSPAGAQAPLSSPQALPQVLKEGAATLQEKITDLRAQVTESNKKLARAKTHLKERQTAVASIKAALAVKKPPLPQIEEFQRTYQNLESDLADRIKSLSDAIDDLLKIRETQLREQNTLRVQMNVLQSQEPALKSPAIQEAYHHYLQLAGVRNTLRDTWLGLLQKQRQVLEEEKALVDGVLPVLKKEAESWKTELLKRQVQQLSFREQVTKVWDNLSSLPGRVWHWFAGLVASGALGMFFWSHLAALVGLLGFIALMGWSTRRLNGWAQERFHRWRAETDDLHLLPLFILGLIVIRNLFLLGLIFWLVLFCWVFSLLEFHPVQIILSILVTLWILRLGLRAVHTFFAGKAEGGVLSLDAFTARYYRRSFKIFLVYLFLGLLGLAIVDLLGFPPTSREFLEHFFQVMILFWILWFLRRAYLVRLLPALPDPPWVRRLEVMQALRGLVIFLLTVIVLADLLGFQHLSFYLAQGVTWTWLDLMLIWLLWLMAERILVHLLHPEESWAQRRFPERQEVLQRLYSMGRWLLSLLLGAGVAYWSLYSWGIKASELAWAFQWMSWGPNLGPVHLTVLHLGGALLAIYLGVIISRFLRALVTIKIFPYTGLDSGVQYTIATSLHYVVLILAIIVALNIVGFPLTNLFIVAGALGVGIGFGLQNIVNNFLSGLILLFERPIKVGDMLVIDGQWGKVKEIKVRSTVFETFDRYVLIIPNSDLVSNKVINWTHYGAGINRLTLKVGVSYGSDVRKVTELLTEVCKANPRVVDDPPPQIYFGVYGDSSLDFTIWVHLWTPSDRIPATHELNTAIFETFQQRGIEIPFPQRDLHIKEWPGELEKKEGES